MFPRTDSNSQTPESRRRWKHCSQELRSAHAHRKRTLRAPFRPPSPEGQDPPLGVAGVYCSEDKTLLAPFPDMWNGSPGETTIQHTDLMPGSRPISSAPYRAGPRAREAEQSEVDRKLAKGGLLPAQSLWGSPVVLLPKPDGSLRFCNDYRKRNSIIVKCRYPIPRIDERIDSLGTAKVFYTLDGNSGY